MPDFTLAPARLSIKPVLENLMHLYLYEFTDYTGDDADDQGRFIDEHLERYWVEPERFPFVVQVGEKYAGFVLVRQISAPGETPCAYSIAEFFIMRKYRRQGIGKRVAWQAFDRFHGHWVVEEMPENLPAQRFWRRIIAEYTGGKYQETQRPEWDGPVQEFDVVRVP
jgi:predicted acetyltransferase